MKNLLKCNMLSLLLFLFAIITSACGSGGSSGSCEFTGYPNILGKLTLSKDYFKINKGQTDKITAYVDGKDKTQDATFTIQSEKEETTTKKTIANVDKGTITAINAGTAVINVHIDNTEEDKTFTVNVIDPTLPTLEVVKTLINIEFGDTANLENIIVKLNGQDVTDNVSFTSTDENVATVDENGNINVIGEGETQIIIHLDGANDQIVTIKVTLPELEINKNEINLQVGDEAQNTNKDNDDITVRLRGEDKIADGEAIFVSSDPNIATVDENGHITAVAEGEAIITVNVEGAKTSEIKVKVYDPALHRIILDNDDTVNLKVNETKQIIVKIKDQDKTEKAKFEIVGEDKTIASVSDTGLITALKEGVTKIKVHLDDTEEDVEITVIVYNPALHTLLYSSNDIPTQTINSKEYMIMYEGETGHIKISIAGEDKTKEGRYIVNPTGIITVENTEQNPGLITAIKKGDTVLTLKHDVATEGPVDVNVKVMESPQLITTNLNIIQGYTGQIVIKNLSGEDITNKFSFTSENNNIATVDTNGKVTLKQGKNTTITATYNDGITPFTYTINVTAQKTLTNTGSGVNATALTYDETQQIITILMDTGMISNENDVDNIVKIDKTNGQTTITITIDRPDGTQVAVVAYENGEIKYISTGEVQNNQVTVDVQHSNQNIVAQTDSNGNVTSTVVTPGFYDSNNNLLYDWNTVVGWGWNFSKDYNFWDATSQTGHFYKILAAHGDLKNATKLVIPERVSKMGNCCFYNCTISLDTIVFPNDYTYEAIGSTVHMIQANLQNYTIRSDNPHFDSINGIVYSEDHKRLLVCPKNKTNIRVLDGTTYISGQAFEKNISKSVGPYDSGAEIEFPNTVETFNWSVFHSMPYLRWAELWNGFKYSYGDPFVNCANLESLYIPSSVITIQRVSNGQEMVNIVCYCPKVKIYCEPTSKPTGWANYWNAKTPNNSPLADTYWGVSRETYRANNRYLNI